MAQQWLSIVEYARAYNISDMTIRRRIKTGKLSATLKDGKYFIPVDSEKLPRRDGDTPSFPNSSPPLPSANGVTVGSPTDSSHPPESSHHQPNPFPAHYIQSAQAGSSHNSPFTSPALSSSPPPSSTPVPPPAATSSNPISISTSTSHSLAESSSSWSPARTNDTRPASAPDSSQLPKNLTSPLNQNPAATVNIHAAKLLSFCEDFIQQAKLQQQEVTKSYENKLLYLEKSLEFKEAKITELQQKIEDLELLIKIFEAKTASESVPTTTPAASRGENLRSSHFS